MSKLKEMLEQEGEIGFILERDECRKFLRFAKVNGFKWINGQEIQESDDCFFHTVVKGFAPLR